MIPLDPVAFTSVLAQPTYLENPPHLPVAPSVIMSGSNVKSVEEKVCRIIVMCGQSVGNKSVIENSFSYFSTETCCGYSIETSHQDISYEHPNTCLN